MVFSKSNQTSGISCLLMWNTPTLILLGSTTQWNAFLVFYVLLNLRFFISVSVLNFSIFYFFLPSSVLFNISSRVPFTFEFPFFILQIGFLLSLYFCSPSYRHFLLPTLHQLLIAILQLFLSIQPFFVHLSQFLFLFRF